MGEGVAAERATSNEEASTRLSGPAVDQRSKGSPIRPDRWDTFSPEPFAGRWSLDDRLPGAAIPATSFACIAQDQSLLQLSRRLHLLNILAVPSSFDPLLSSPESTI
ncbi:hypothetical protein TNCV_4246761 [Trichonephila clavipes]|nr:hypothetical protein TNCV_4246761 [Trichonephila clavipes]